MTRANIDQVCQLIEEDIHLSIKIVSTVLSISYGSANTILHNHLNMKRSVLGGYQPHHEQNRQRVTSAQEIIDIFDRAGRGRLSDIVTGHEKWFHFL